MMSEALRVPNFPGSFRDREPGDSTHRAQHVTTATEKYFPRCRERRRNSGSNRITK
jgi:hypothetical protein